MSFIADFHIHSHFSRATSKDLAPEHIDRWARIKGIQVVGTGDFTHPGWIQELKEKLIPAEPGLYRLKSEFQLEPDFHESVRFLLTAEISTIYKKRGKVRKIHHVVFAPDFETAEKIIHRLTHLGFHLTADGRPILGMDSKDLLAILLEISPDLFFVPAHIWTPWFSILGEKSGFDSISECFEDLTPFIYALETGLSSDPPMNWLCSTLDQYVLISNSDAHSPEKLGREANRFETELSYFAMCEALRTKDKKRFCGTIEFFPQEGKYHYDGHRKCEISWPPEETVKHQGICPKCGKPVTIGVLHRVYQLADRREITDRASRFPYVSVIPLIEMLSEIYKVTSPTPKVKQEYFRLVKKLGPELTILLDLPIEEIHREGGEILAEAIQRMREGKVWVQSGFDGEYGVIRVFDENEILTKTQVSLFQEETRASKAQTQAPPLSPGKTLEMSSREKIEKRPVSSYALDEDQKQAVEHPQGPAMVIAGPGSGKTRVLAHRIVHLIQQGIAPESILAITFTHKAAEAMRERTLALLGEEKVARVRISTFHALGYSILCESTLSRRILDISERHRILESLVPPEKVKSISEAISLAKQHAEVPKEKELLAVYTQYEALLEAQGFWDLDDLILKPLVLFGARPEVLSLYRSRFQWILVDEFQDVNKAQYELLRFLAPEPNSCLWVVGDPDQAIYGFRGASPKFIQQFQKDYPNTKVYVLKQSYRCPQVILNASGRVLLRSPNFLKGKETNTKVHVSSYSSDRAEAEFVARTIESMLGGVRFFSIDSGIASGEEKKLGFSDFAVLYRIEKQKDVLESAFCDHGIPFQSVDVEPISQREPFSSILKVFKALLYPHVTMYQNAIAELSLEGSSLQSLREKGKVLSTKEILAEIFFLLGISDSVQTQPELQSLFSVAEEFSNDPEGFVRWMLTGTRMEIYRPHIEAVSLMTLHAAKGLEWECVFIVGVEEGLLPYRLFEHQVSDIEEERRLLYVGMTRARRSLFLTHAEKRILFGREFRLPRSSFLQDMDEQWVEVERFQKPKKSEPQQLKLF